MSEPVDTTAAPEAETSKAAESAKLRRNPDEPDGWDRAAEWVLAHGALPLVALLTVAVFLIHMRIFLGETAGDDLSFHFAESARISDCIRGFDLDCWNPSANAGPSNLFFGSKSSVSVTLHADSSSAWNCQRPWSFLNGPSFSCMSM